MAEWTSCSRCGCHYYYLSSQEHSWQSDFCTEECRDGAEVIDIDERRPHYTAEAHCSCGHSWVAVAPVGTTVFECPSCHAKEPADADVE